MLRVGILLDSTKVSHWVAEIIHKLDHPQVKIVVVVCNAAPPQSKKGKFLYKIFRKIDRAFLPGRPDVFAKVNLKLPEHVPIISITPEKRGIRNAFRDEDLAQVNQYQPDLLLRFGFGILTGRILKVTKWGVWSLHHGDVKWFRGGPPGFWEWFYRVPFTGVTLQRLTEDLDGGSCVATTITKTDPTSFSRNQAAVFSKGIDLMADAIIYTAITGAMPVVTPSLSLYSSRLYKDPGFLDAVRAFWKVIIRAIPLAITRNFFIEQWALFYNFRTAGETSVDFRKFKTLLPPIDRSWADPFVVSANDRHYIFIEELIIKNNKGHISCLVLNDRGQIETSSIVLEKPYHLSYPFLFQENNTWYMIPESAANRTVDLYECVSFPFEWKFKKTLMAEVEAFDSTLLKRDNTYWLFCTLRKRKGTSPNDDLYIFYTDDFLEGVWTPHQANPVVNNPAQARPAGTIFEQDAHWYRPSQICTPRYGYGISFNRIDRLDREGYKEVPVTKAEPRWRKNLLTMHTLNVTAKLTITDGQLKRWAWKKGGYHPMKILFVMDSLSTGGAEYSTLRLAGWLKNVKRWDVKVLYLKEKQPAYQPTDFGLEGSIVPMIWSSWLRKWVGLFTIIRTWQPIVVHSVLLYSNFFSRLVRLFHRGPIFMESLVNRTYDDSRFNDPKVNSGALKVFRLMDRWSQKFGTDYFHAVTNDIADHFHEHTGTPKRIIDVVYRGRMALGISNTPDVMEHLKTNLGVGRDTLVFLTAGRHEYQKGHIFLIKAYQEFARRYAGNSCLLIAGREGSETRELQAYLSENKLTDSVRLLGHRDDLMHLMRVADVFVLPSLFEGIGGVLIEAEAAGLPIICSDLEGLKEVVEENINALIVPPADVASLTKALARMANDAPLRKQFGVKGKQIFETRFEESMSHENMVRFYLGKVK